MQVYYYDEKKYFTYSDNIDILDEDLEKREREEGFTTTRPLDGFLNPRFVDETRIEGASQKDVIESFLVTETRSFSPEELFLIIAAYLKGGVDMFMKVMLNFWIEGKIDSSYLDKAVTLKVLTKEEADFIKLSPIIKK